VLPEGQDSFFARYEIAILHDRHKNGNIKSIAHMQKDATKPSQAMATEDADGKLTWKNGFKEGDSNASGTYDVCASDGTECDVPQPNRKYPKPGSKPEAPASSKPSKRMAFSIAMITHYYGHGTSVSFNHEWKFYTTSVGKAVGSCGETDGKEIVADTDETPRASSDSKTPFPGGIFKLDIEGEACTYKCNGNTPGGLFCPLREITCRENSKKNMEVGAMKCGRDQFFAPSVFCDF